MRERVRQRERAIAGELNGELAIEEDSEERCDQERYEVFYEMATRGDVLRLRFA